MNEQAATIKLSEREKTVLTLVAEGLSSRAIAKSLFVSENTVETHRRNIIRKSGKPNMPSALSIAYRQGIII